GIRLIGRCMEDLIVNAIYQKEETSPKQATDLREKALTVLHYATTGLTLISRYSPAGGLCHP
ncbi:MAG: hypothetical protein KKE57_10565, partial [Proteobacteria bacterium]|nr:hypothetical protein [Pseudomonadota bacterium]